MKTDSLNQKISAMREGGRITALILAELAKIARPGITTIILDKMARDFVRRFGARAAFLNFEGYPAALCTSVNEVAVHGLPSNYVLNEGDILSLDFGVKWKGYYTDAAVTVGIGAINPEARKLLAAAEEALSLGIAQAKACQRVGDISAAIRQHVEANGFSILKELSGHGVGAKLHEPPNAPNSGRAGTGPELLLGMTIAIEPIISAGGQTIRRSKDGFGYETVDGSLTAHFEHTVLITENEPEILTV